MKTTLALSLIILILTTIVAGTQFLLVGANIMPAPPELPNIYIKSDGNIEPSTTLIQKSGSVYTVTGNITGYTIAIQRNGTILDGAGYGLNGNGIGRGIALRGTNNVTVKNLKLGGFRAAIEVVLSSGNKIIGNMISDSDTGIYLSASSDNDIIGNGIMANAAIVANSFNYSNIIENQITATKNYGITLEIGYYSAPSSYNNIIKNNITSTSNVAIGILIRGFSNCRVEANTIANVETGVQLGGARQSIIGNTIVNNKYGINMPGGAEHCLIVGNVIANNEEGISISNSNDTLFYHNSFINNQNQVSITTVYLSGYEGTYFNFSVPPRTFRSVNMWDNGEEGNYWSNYTGKDGNNDGLGDAAHVIDAYNTDRYPLVDPVATPLIPIPDLPEAETQTKPTQDSFPTSLFAASAGTVAAVGAGLLVYFKRRRH
jgi:parallel beta-helix repeat protein